VGRDKTDNSNNVAEEVSTSRESQKNETHRNLVNYADNHCGNEHTNFRIEGVGCISWQCLPANNKDALVIQL